MRNRLQFATLVVCALLCLSSRGETVIAASTSNHWAFQPLTPQKVPAVKDASHRHNPVDAFVLARLSSTGLRLSPIAPSPALLRRLSFDLTGLPPSSERTTGFDGFTPRVEHSQIDNSTVPDVIEQLLASSQFGERWGRWWLDAAGYVDVLNLDNDPGNPKVATDKWRYRDYVVQSIVEDKSFDRFLLEQLAGDELVNWRNADAFTDEMRTLLTATGFLRAAPDETEVDESNTPDVHHALLQETAENVAANLLGLTLNCARCHDHKYEPVTQRDYFSFLAHFAAAFNPQAWLRPKDRIIIDLPKSEQPAQAKSHASLDAELDTLKKAQQAIRDRYRDQLLEVRLPRMPAELRSEGKIAARTPFEKRTEEQRRLVGRFERLLRVTIEEVRAALTPTDKTEWERLDNEIAGVNSRRPVPPQIHAVFDTDKPAPVHILRRGEFDKPADLVQPAIPAVLRPVGRSETTVVTATPKHGLTTGHRLILAQQLTAPNSPAASLIARVLMNRVWQQLFGRGLVESSSNLGVSGARPTHPELLDWLAGEFIRNGWRLKPIIRLIVNSTTYQQSSSTAADPALASLAQRADPTNDLLWHQRLRRLESEMVRDSLLAVSGELNLQAGGPPILTELRPDGTIDIATNKPARPEDAFRRSLYLLQRRTYHPTLLAAFDQPLLNANCLRRPTSTSVAQSLTLLNDVFVNERAEALSKQICTAQPDTSRRVELAFTLVLGRKPSVEESDWSQALAEREGVRLLTNGASLAAAREGALARVCHTLLNTSEFLSIP